MFIFKSSWTNRSGKTYRSIWLKESYRENGKVKSRYVLNLKDWPDEVVDALQIALDYDRSKTSDKSSKKQTPIDLSD
jgi:hypothetical protein